MTPPPVALFSLLLAVLVASTGCSKKPPPHVDRGTKSSQAPAAAAAAPSSSSSAAAVPSSPSSAVPSSSSSAAAVPSSSAAAVPSSSAAAVPSSSQSAPLASKKKPRKKRTKRRYQFFEPKTNEAVPLLVVLHGYGSSARMVSGALQLRRAARRLGVAIAVPNGLKDRTDRRFWNATDACCDFDKQAPDDVAAVRRLVRRVRKRRAIHKGRIAVLGYSNGAFMAHRLACDASDLVGYAIAISGSNWKTPEGHCKPKQPVAILQMHGLDDRVVPFKGGKVLGRKDMPLHASAPASVAFWAKHNGCTATRRETTRHVYFPVNRQSHTGCKATTELWAVKGVGHSLGLSLRTIERLLKRLNFGKNAGAKTPTDKSGLPRRK